MTVVLDSPHAAGAAFDTLATHYDDLFTFTIIGRAQREIVWNRAASTFLPGDHVLEINCGTGEDAIFLAQRGIRITACDASEQMVRHARARHQLEVPHSPISFQVLPTERIHELPEQHFDGVLSNFSGLNCVEDLHGVSRDLARIVRPGAKLLLCLSTRFCLWEALHYTLKGNFRKAIRRWGGKSLASFERHPFFVYYPTLASLRKSFSPEFRLRSITGIGITTPPSYLEGWISEHTRLLAAMKKVDKLLCDLPFFRSIGDHVLLSMERV
ncbi:methyltransferase domain-containing protein [Alloacidobacterium dinghuense]|uniref:Methyltransferase domain-containing protein n=1 Tax=Alloacidobacterium dinghuense TaxID=2763107 RepID=A0A7G8BMJ1_9BACT|nr:methyltransferase domain-containing protein [Alloacidobacterium dinghuense]QNI33761.1 methyltransferase domain-containing protein [Alloacidobacterium dinghuense]